jgi:hypothetical protein
MAGSSSKGGIKDSNGIPKLTPMKGYDGLGILTPATSPKNQQQQQQQQQQTANDGHLLNGSNGNVESLQTPVSPATSPNLSSTTSYQQQQLKKTES